jgi:uncharacterized membrane protein YphA (DoxX/SURF4 family)
MKRIILFIVCLLFGLMFINAGLDKFFHYMPQPKEMPEPMVKQFGAIMQIGWLLPLIGTAEILGGLLFIFPKTRALGALIIFPVMVGILLTTFSLPLGGSAAIPLVLAAILIWVMIENRHKYAPLVS